MSPKLFIAMLDNKRDIDLSKTKRLAMSIASYVWSGKDVEDSNNTIAESPWG